MLTESIFHVYREAILSTVYFADLFSYHCPLSIRSLRAGNVRYRLKVWKKNERESGYFI